MRVPKKSTATYKKAYFFHPILPAFPNLPALPIFPAFSAFSIFSLVSPVPQSPVRLAVSLVPALSIFSAFSALSEKKSSIASLYFRYTKDIASPKDYQKMSEVQTSNRRLKTRKISYANPIHNLFQISYYSQPS